MRFEKGEKLSGFRIIRVRSSRELNGELTEMVHEKTGARLVWLDNGAENKTFSISFRTLPRDNTGVFHILEHSVLCGSEKYPVKEPFVELLKGSMNTFLNAMTFPDMTMYPVSSRNDTDLLNLSEVYLDAVFRPRAMKDERIFCQEGWHIESDGNEKYIYKGVVFNEMKGAMSDVNEVGETEMARLLFPESGYGYNSGGDPSEIPSLTYEKYRETYRLHYHPSNAWIYLDGDVPINQMIALISRYLDSYEKEENIPRFTYQKPVSSVQTREYELGKEEDSENRGHLYLSRILGSWQDKTLNMAAGVIGDVLTGNNDSPLKRRILEKGLAQNFSLSVDDSSLQSVLTMHAENVTDGKEQDIIDEIEDFAEELQENGLDIDAAEASLNRFAYMLKEEEEPQGIERAIRVMGTWLYDGDPLFALENDEQVAEMRRMLQSGRMNSLALSLLKEHAGMCRLTLRPSKNLGEKLRKEEAERLEAVTHFWTQKDRSDNEALIQSLQAWQETPDSPEALSSLPMLKKEDADIPPEWPETELIREQDVPILFHSQPTGGIVHLRAYFRLSDLTMEQLQNINLFCSLMGKLPTEKHDSAALQQEIRRYTGRISFAVTARNHPGNPGLCSPCLVASVSALKENLNRAEQLLAEILKTTRLESTDRIMEIVRQLDLYMRQRIVGAGQIIALRNVLSHYSAEYALKNALEGEPAVRFLHSFAAKPEKMLSVLRDTAQKMMKDTIVRNRAALSLTAEETESCEVFLSWLPEGDKVDEYRSFSAKGARRQGYRVPAQVGFAARGYRLSELSGMPFHGSLYLLSNILTYSYLWNKVRVQGGAYGCGFHADRYGNLFSMSYRDPTPGLTLNVDSGASAFLREFLAGGESMDKYIISTLNDLNPLLSAREKGAVADSRYFSGHTRDEAEKLRKEILYAGPETLEKAFELLDTFAKQGAVCVVGPGELLEKCEGLIVEDL